MIAEYQNQQVRQERQKVDNDKEQLFRIAVEMIGCVVLVRVELPHVEVQVLRADTFPFTGNIREQAESVYFAGIRLKIPFFFPDYCCHEHSLFQYLFAKIIKSDEIAGILPAKICFCLCSG